MSGLLKYEFRKLRKQKSFYICTIIMIALLFLSAFTSKALFDANEEFSEQFKGSALDSAVGAVSGCSYLLIVGIFTALFVCDDYENQTIKNIYSKGYSRTQAYFSKFISVVFAATVMFAVVISSGFLFGNIYFGIGDASGYNWFGIIAAQYAVCIANISFYFAICSFLRKNGSSIASVIVAPMLVSMLLGLADSLLKSEKIELARFWISSFMKDLSAAPADNGRVVVCLTASLIYIPVFAVIGAVLHKNTEI